MHSIDFIINESYKNLLIQKVESLGIQYANIYVVGSRVWGFFSEKSDYDVFIEVINNNKVNLVHMLETIKKDKFDIKIKTNETIFCKTNGQFDLPKYNIVTKEIQHVNTDDIIDWVHYRLKNKTYINRYSSLKQWYYDTFNISNKINLPL